MKPLFTDDEVDFIIKYYPLYAAEYCANHLHKPLKQVKTKITKLRQRIGLKLLPDVRKKLISISHYKKLNNEYAVNPENFFEIKTKEVAYLLGLIWADGYVYHKAYKNRISVEMVEDDLKLLIPIFNTTGKWSVVHRHRKDRRPQMCISTNNKPLLSFLEKHDYKVKSDKSADKIISLIPANLQHYWFRGLIDGDGCFYINKTNNCRQFSICSSFNQNWKYLENLLKNMNISYKILRYVEHQNKNKCSWLRITNRNHIKKLGNYIYQNYETDQMGLKRKYDKYKLICDGL